MPLYAFTIEEGHAPVERMSHQLDGPMQAHSEAVVAVGGMLWDAHGMFWAVPGWRMHVTDEQGATVCVLTIAGTTNDR